jgi:hypothetical protein
LREFAQVLIGLPGQTFHFSKLRVGRELANTLIINFEKTGSARGGIVDEVFKK